MVSFLEIDSIEKVFNQKKILSNIHLKCEIGEIIGLFGKNGSGKSTLLKIIFGTEACNHKFIRINNLVVKKLFKVKNGVSYLPQFQFIPSTLTVSMAFKLFLLESELESILEDEIIKPILKNKISSLSTGEQRYISLILTLHSSSKFCLLDEPFSGISPILIENIKQKIIKTSKYKGIIITDHNYLNLLDIVTKIYLLKEGSTLLLKNKGELIDYGYLNEGML